MALIDLISVSKQYDTKVILKEVSLFINEGEKICIIGQNGCGKSTILKMIKGSLEPDDGKRVQTSNIKIELLTQQTSLDLDTTVKEAIENQLTTIKEKLRTYNELASNLGDSPSELKEFQEVGDYLDFHDAWNIDDKVKRVIEEFNLGHFEDSYVRSLSGGEQKRVELASLLLKQPDVMLLDEPTNHLDVYMVKFLENMLTRSKSTIVFISHDRYFIDKVASRCVEVEYGNVTSFDGGYQNYLRGKQELLLNLAKQNDSLSKLLKREEEWLRRGVKARLKRNEGRKKRVLELRDVNKSQSSMLRKMSIDLSREIKGDNGDKTLSRRKMLFEIINLKKSLGDKLLIKNFSTRILLKDVIAVVGKNGTGKSTLLKLLISEIKPDRGKIKIGEFKVGYFDQHLSMLDVDKDLIETFCPQGGDRVDVKGHSIHVYGYLKSFLFPREELTKKIKFLSGGERKRVALALLFTKKYDCLILDEPTNDLDIQTINIVENYINDFEGSVIFVSHDRYFVDKLARKTFILKDGGEVEESFKTYSEILEIEEELQSIEKLTTKVKEVTPVKETIVTEKKVIKKLSYKEQLEYDGLAKEIESLEDEVKELEISMSDPEIYNEIGLNKLNSQFQEKTDKLNIKVERFFELEEKVN
ncbi:MAG: COG0488: ATPase components of ABC transporters with duplicated ATPase domains [uncultured Campylobacterales bacterium]|uniref:COG0488: ATPase components of ABC transporters with duplicated ATPase domains n=1 Tax=uncultured Campylobacterales bacterium TaxID=352960 RepID=A0A6S6S430_9BACT|nr:MAG: COG0488: ATPase components of ABC transporters with duplicated ATPase domains [uncultured Campylobacterales bacterium]